MSQQQQGQQKSYPHDFSKWKIVYWPYCAHCGLILLKNEATRRQANKPCPRD